MHQKSFIYNTEIRFMTEEQIPHRIFIPEVKTSEIVHKGYFNVRVDLLQLPHGPKLSYSVIEIGAHAAVILARTKEGKFVINKEYRHPPCKWLLSCPGGRIDTGESPLEAGRRELLEETGYGGGTFTLAGTAYSLPALTEQLIHYVYVENAELLQPPALEPFELIRTELKTEQELMVEIASGSPVDGILCTALLLCKPLWQ
jgi:ADP-ribose pyrophosphatase